LTLDLTDRRLAEITGLQSAGRPIPQTVVDRFQGELDQALELAAGMENPVMVQSLEKVSRHTRGQLQTMALLVERNPASPHLADIYARLQEQAQAAEQGEADPQGFRLKVHQHLQDREQKSGNGQGGQVEQDGTPVPHGNGDGSGGNQSDGTPGRGRNGSGNDKTTKTPRNHGQGPGSPEATHQPGKGSGH
jgi:hypothetical protein